MVHHHDAVLNGDYRIVDYFVFYFLQLGLRQNEEYLVLHILVLDDILEKQVRIDALMHHLDAIRIVVLLTITAGRDGLIRHLLVLSIALLKELLH